MRNTKFDETKVEIKEGARLGYEINMTSSHFRYLKKKSWEYREKYWPKIIKLKETNNYR